MKTKEPHYKHTGFTLIELILVLSISVALFIASNSFISSYSIGNQITKMAYASINIFRVGSTRGRMYGSPCSHIYSDSKLSTSSDTYTVLCSESGRNISIIVTGKKSLAGIKYELSNTGPNLVMRTYLSGTIITKFDPPPTSTTIEDCIVGNLDLSCIRKSSGFIPTP